MSEPYNHHPIRDVFFFILSIYALIAISADMLLELPIAIRELIIIIDTAVCVLFFVDFLEKFYHAPSRRAYMKWGWADLVASLPGFFLGPYLYIPRMFRIIRIVKDIYLILKRKKIPHPYRGRKAEATLETTAAMMVIMLIVGSYLILYFEGPTQGSITTAFDAFYFCVTTMTTTGYGDLTAVTTAGRAVSIALMVGGVMGFGVFTAFVADWFRKK